MPCLQIRPHTDHRSTDSRATFARRASPKPPSAPQRTLLRFGMQNRQPKRPADVPHLQIQSRDDYYRQIRMPHLQRQSHDDHHMEATRVAIAIPTSPQPAKPPMVALCDTSIQMRHDELKKGRKKGQIDPLSVPNYAEENLVKNLAPSHAQPRQPPELTQIGRAHV